eukprot:m.220830 g.220830  ORF g.220830 m.220830 type:complete len:73 (-) comp10467_c0_seq1:95-313(-)
MTRGLAKLQAKEKAAKKNARTQGAPQHDEKAAREAQLKITCSVCKLQLSDLHVYKAHFEAKHPKFPTPPELQ